MDYTDIQVFLGLDVGKTSHWATAVDSAGEVLWSKALPNDQSKIQAIYNKLASYGTILVVVDQPATIGALAVATAQAAQISVAYLPGLAMRRIADLYPGNAKTDTRDAFIIAQAARTMPHTLRQLQISDEDEAALQMLTGFDQDLAAMTNQTINRIRGLYLHIHPALERFMGSHLDHRAMLEVIKTWPTPAQLRKAGRARIDAKLVKHGARRHRVWAQELLEALAEQTVVVAGTEAAGLVLPHLAAQLAEYHVSRADIADRIETIALRHPMYPLLTSLPGVAVRTAAVIMAELAGRSFTSAAALASYAGLVPVTRQSGTSIKSDTVSRSGNKRLKRALFLSAFASLRSDPVSRVYYDRKRDQGKRHNQAIIALAHRRSSVIFAMLRDGTFYESRPTQPATAA